MHLYSRSLYLDDDVYLEEEELREEYVLNDVGIIFRGNASKGVREITETHWQFGQVI